MIDGVAIFLIAFTASVGVFESQRAAVVATLDMPSPSVAPTVVASVQAIFTAAGAEEDSKVLEGDEVKQTVVTIRRELNTAVSVAGKGKVAVNVARRGLVVALKVIMTRVLGLLPAVIMLGSNFFARTQLYGGLIAAALWKTELKARYSEVLDVSKQLQQMAYEMDAAIGIPAEDEGRPATTASPAANYLATNPPPPQEPPGGPGPGTSSGVPTTPTRTTTEEHQPDAEPSPTTTADAAAMTAATTVPPLPTTSCPPKAVTTGIPTSAEDLGSSSTSAGGGAFAASSLAAWLTGAGAA